MGHAAFDTLKFAERLHAAGIPEKQAKAISEAQNEAMIEALDNTLATKVDVSRVEVSIKEIETTLKADVSRTESSLKADISKVESTLKLNIAHIEAEVKLLKWMTGFLLAGTATLIIKAFF